MQNDQKSYRALSHLSYVEGFIMPVLRINRDKFIDFSDMADKLWTEHGAERIAECWPDEYSSVRTGDFFTAADGREGEVMVFSWIEWQDKATRCTNLPSLLSAMQTDPRFDPVQRPFPFDNDRVISGCFRTMIDLGEPAHSPYVQGFVLPVDEAHQATFCGMVERGWEHLRRLGAQRLLVSWQDDFPQGKQMDFCAMVNARQGERIAFALIEWPSCKHCESANWKFPIPPESTESWPFDQGRVISAGFSPVILAT